MKVRHLSNRRNDGHNRHDGMQKYSSKNTMTKKERARKVLTILRKSYERQMDSFVMWKTPLELVIGTVLAAQCTDRRVNAVTRNLFAKYTTAEDYARARISTLGKDIHSITYFRAKARYLKGIGQMLVRNFNSEVPDTLDALLTLPGVGRKSAYLILSKVHKRAEGIAVDTHVKRIAPRLGLTTHADPDRISRDLSALYSSRDYLDVNEFFIMHGRKICVKNPRCWECPVAHLCPSAQKNIRQHTRALHK